MVLVCHYYLLQRQQRRKTELLSEPGLLLMANPVPRLQYNTG